MINFAFILEKLGFTDYFTIPQLSSILKKEGCNVKLFLSSEIKGNKLSELIKFKPDIVGYSLFSNQQKEYYAINSYIKSKMRVFSLFGGPHPTFFSQMISEKDVDAICIGEADTALPLFIRNFQTKNMYQTPNFYFNRNGEIVKNELLNLFEDLDQNPFPDRKIVWDKSLYLSRNSVKTFISGRGCPFNCSYCFNHKYNRMFEGKGPIVRLKSVSYFFEEIKQVKAAYPMQFIKIHDDIFGLDSKWTEEFIERYPKEIGLPFLCYARANIVNDSYCKNLKKAGCYSVMMGIECGNEEIRNKILKRNMSDEQITRAAGLFNKYGIKIYSLNMIGLPSESPSQISETIRINQKCNVSFADTSIFSPFPGTDIVNYCMEKGLISKGFEKEVKSQYEETILSVPKILKKRIFITQRLFPMIVDNSWMEVLVKNTAVINIIYFLKPVLNVVYRLYFGYFVKKRIYPTRPSFLELMAGIKNIVFPKLMR